QPDLACKSFVTSLKLGESWARLVRSNKVARIFVGILKRNDGNMSPKTRRMWVLALPLLISGGAAFPVVINQMPTANAAPASNGAPDMILLAQDSKFEREKTQYLQENILDKILGPGKAVVIVDVEMGLESGASEMGMGKSKSDKKKNEGDDGTNPAPAARVLVPGVPMPKSVIQMEEDR